MEVIPVTPNARGLERSEEFAQFLKAHGIEKTGEKRFKVNPACNLGQKESISVLLALVSDFLFDFDILSSGVDPKLRPLEFGNQLGVFYADNIAN